MKPARLLSETATWMLLATGLFTGWQPVRAQENAPPPDDLKIVIIRGDGFTNNLKKRIAREPIVEVRDRNDKPVAGATVTFLLPSGGPGGTFAGAQNTLTVFTGPNGRAVASGFTPNNVVGDFNMNVTASHQGQTASATIAQTNALAGAGLGTAATVGIIGAVAAAAAAVAVAVTGGGNTGRISVGAPSLQ